MRNNLVDGNTDLDEVLAKIRNIAIAEINKIPINGRVEFKGDDATTTIVRSYITAAESAALNQPDFIRKRYRVCAITHNLCIVWRVA